MPCSQAQKAKRAFVTLLRALARKWALNLTISRDSTDAELITAFKRVARKVGRESGQAEMCGMQWEDLRFLFATFAASGGKDAKGPVQTLGVYLCQKR